MFVLCNKIALTQILEYILYTVLEIHTGKLGIFLPALLFRAALLLDFWNFSYWHYYLGRHFYSVQESRHFILALPDVYKNWLFTFYKLALPCSVIFAVFSIGGDAESLSTVHKGPIRGIFFRSSGLEAIAEKRPRDQTDFLIAGFPLYSRKLVTLFY